MLKAQTMSKIYLGGVPPKCGPIKVKVKRNADIYPYLGELDGFIVYFTSPHSGILLVAPEKSKLLYQYDDNWDEPKFTKFKGKITLKNA